MTPLAQGRSLIPWVMVQTHAHKSSSVIFCSRKIDTRVSNNLTLCNCLKLQNALLGTENDFDRVSQVISKLTRDNLVVEHV
jgi:hypothetical protein